MKVSVRKKKQPDAPEHRVIIEMGMGNSQYTQDYTRAAIRAVEDAFRRSSLPLFEATGLPHAKMRVQVTVAVQHPERVDRRAVAKALPRGRAEVTAVFGGLDVPREGQGPLVIAAATVEAFLPVQAGKWAQPTTFEGDPA